MRLLDLLAQNRSTRVFATDGSELPSGQHFSQIIRNCPLRYVLSDDLVRCATQLAYAEGDRLSACLDLVRVPAKSLWVEWADAPRREALAAIPALALGPGAPARHAGALVTAASDCRSGLIRTFWSDAGEQAYLSPVVTRFDFSAQPVVPGNQPTIWRAEALLRLEGEPAIEELLQHLRYNFDDQWAAYYDAHCKTAEIRSELLRRSLGGCAFDGPMLMALFLLLTARDLLPRREVNHSRLNRVRHRGSKPALLEHVELAAPLDAGPRMRRWVPSVESSRLSRRLHHVRGHIVRRGTAVFWRSPHLRGSARLGKVRTRTVVLAFGKVTAELPNACY